jgi:hypothetical protein
MGRFCRKPCGDQMKDTEKYRGDLAKLLTVKRWPSLEVDAAGLSEFDRVRAIIEAQKRQDEQIEEMLRPEHDKRWALLFAHFGLRNGDWQGVARCLAGAHVTGFRIRRTLEINRLAGIHQRMPKAARRPRELNFFGFRVVGKIGKTSVWDDGLRVLLYGDYLRYRREGESQPDVLVRLLCISPWQDMYPPKLGRPYRQKDSTVRTLVSRLAEGKRIAERKDTKKRGRPKSAVGPKRTSSER